MHHNPRPALSAAAVLAVAAALTATSAAAAAPPSYALQTIDALTTPATHQGAPARLMAFDAAGNGYGYSLVMDGADPVIAAVRWEQGNLVTLPTPAGATSSHAAAVAPSGDVVGWYGGESARGGAIWHDGAMRPLGEFLPTGINASGAIAGVVRNPADPRRHAPALWRSGRIEMLPMTSPAAHGWAVGVSGSGDVAGSWYDGRADHRAVRWSGGEAHLLPLPEGTGRSEALAINGAGLIVGSAYRDGTAEHVAVLWQAGHAIDLGVLDAATPDAWAQSINNSNQIVGSALTRTGRTAFLWQDGVMHDLRALIEGGFEGELNVANLVIGDTGHITGVQFLEDGTTRAFVLTPVPAPGAAVLLVVAAGRSRRRRG